MFEDHPPLPLPKPTSTQLRVVHETCERFERAWREGQSLTIEQLLEETTRDVRPYLLEALVRSEVELLDSSGTPAEPQQYLQRFVADSGIVARAFMPADKLDALDSLDTCPSLGPSLGSLGSLGSDQPSSPSAAPTRLGPFELRGEIGRGGMGVVYRGWDNQLKREVAIKCIRFSGIVDDHAIERFHREAQTVAALKHDGIVPIYEVNSDAGLNYFVMPLIEGENLSVRMSRHPVTHRELAKIVRDVAIATQFAHQHGVVHRDLKPHNILVDQTGKVWVTDFGLAKSLESTQSTLPSNAERGDQSTTQIVGTPSFMAPEQLRGRANELTDVYGLGAVLYTGLTGRPPHRAATMVQTFKQIAETEPVAPRALDPQVPQDLETIALKALSKDPADRYASAREMADELTRFLEGRPILAKAISTPERVWRWMKREPVIASLGLGIIAALSIGLCISLAFYRLATVNADAATRSAETARQTVKSYLTDVAESPELNEQGLEVLRRQLLNRALTYYEELAQQKPDSPVLQEQVAQAHQQLGLIHKSFGDLEQALQQYQQMQLAYAQLATQAPTATHYALSHVDAILEQAQILSTKNQPDETDKLLRQGIDICQRLTDSREHATAARVYLASLYASQVEHYSNIGQGDQQKTSIEHAIRFCEEVVTAPRTELTTVLMARLVRSLDMLALHLQASNQLESSEKLSKLGIQLCTTQLDPNMPHSQYLEARLHKNLCTLYLRTKRPDAAQTEFAAADSLLKALREKHPVVSDYIDTHAVLLSNQAVMFANQGNFDPAKQSIQQAIVLQQQLTSRQSEQPELWEGLSNMYATLGSVLRTTGNLPESEAALCSGLEAYEKVQQLSVVPKSENFFKLNLINSLSETLTALGRPGEAAEQLRSVTEDAAAVIENNQSANVTVLILGVSVFRSLCIAERKSGHADQAFKAAEQAIVGYEKIPAPFNSTGMVPRLLTDSLLTLAHGYFQQMKFIETQSALDRGLGVLNGLVENPNTPKSIANIFLAPRGDFYDLAGQVSAAQQDHAKALELYQKSIADQQQVLERVKDQPHQFKSMQDLHAPVQIHLARSLMQLNQHEAALKACDAAIALDTQYTDQAQKLRDEITSTIHLAK